MTSSIQVSELLERHGSFAVTMLRSLLVGIELNKNVTGWSEAASQRAEEVFVQALEADRAALVRPITAIGSQSE